MFPVPAGDLPWNFQPGLGLPQFVSIPPSPAFKKTGGVSRFCASDSDRGGVRSFSGSFRDDVC